MFSYCVYFCDREISVTKAQKCDTELKVQATKGTSSPSEHQMHDMTDTYNPLHTNSQPVVTLTI